MFLKNQPTFLILVVCCLQKALCKPKDQQERAPRDAFHQIRATLYTVDEQQRVPDKYLVTFTKSLNSQKINDIVTQVTSNVGNVVNSTKQMDFGIYITTIEIEANIDAIDALRSMTDDVRYVEEVQYFYATQSCSCSDQNNPGSWGLDRTDQRSLPLSNKYSGLMPPSGDVNIYIIDTGIYTSHNDFGGRASWGTNTVDNNDGDGNGHGTHVAGTAGGTAYGISKTSNLIGVKVLSDGGSGTTATVVNGMSWVKTHAQANPTKKAVANMSLRGGKSQTLNDKAKELHDAGITVVAAAGNSAADACNLSPASEPTAITVGCTSSSDQLCSFSNYGSCVDILAPGLNIVSAKTNSQDSITLSGTSMSAPHVAGAAANYLGCNSGKSPTDVVTWMTNGATNGAIGGLPSQTVNKLLYYSCSDAGSGAY